MSNLILLKKGNMFLIESKGGKISIDKNAKYSDFVLGSDSILYEYISQNEHYALKFCVRIIKFRYELSYYKIEKVFNESGYFYLKIDMPNWEANTTNFTFNVLPSNTFLKKKLN